MRTDPILVLGMHRSGTSMLTRVLDTLQVFPGQDALRGLAESRFFIDRNEWMLEQAKASWVKPQPFRSILRDPKKLAALEKEVRARIDSQEFLDQYVGENQLSRFQSDDRFLWGWKDPRTTLTWLIWQSIFPEAKLVFIYRNGIDVANSLFKRILPKYSHLDVIEFNEIQTEKIKNSFQLWEAYNEIFYESLAQRPALAVHQICYEDLVSNPAEEVQRMMDFLDIQPSEKDMEAALQKVRNNRRFAFIQDTALLSHYYRFKDTPMMKKLGYDRIDNI